MNGIKIVAREILDSRSRPTIEVEAHYGDIAVTASVPSGKSTGSREAMELRDTDGSVSSAIKNINGEIAEMLSEMELDPLTIDARLRELDGTDNYARLGANSVLAVSIAMRRLASLRDGIPLWQYIAKESGFTAKFPALFMNMINGGAHANFNLPFQEHIAIITGKPSESYALGKEIFEELGNKITVKYGEVMMGDEGGYAPKFQDGEDEAFKTLFGVIEGSAGVHIAIDAAASELYKDGRYDIEGKKLSSQELQEFYIKLIHTFDLKSIEDPFSEFDEEPFAPFLASVPVGTLVVGDDLTVTNKERVEALSLKHSVNAMIVKPNQIGTLSDVYEAVRAARAVGWKIVASHRSGETMDDFLADFAVGIGADGIKAGAPSQAPRRVKYERLIAIEQEGGGVIGI